MKSHFVSFALLLISALGVSSLRGQELYVSQPFEDIEVSLGTETIVIDLKEHFAIDVFNRVVQFDTTVGKLDVELYSEAAPLTVQNFLNNVESGDYDDSFFHGLIYGFVLQGGALKFQEMDDPDTEEIEPDSLIEIPQETALANEFSVSNTAGTLAMTKFSTGSDSATSSWFFNLADNSEELDSSNGGFTVFGNTLESSYPVMSRLSLSFTYDVTLPDYPKDFNDNSDLTTVYDLPLSSSFDNAAILRKDYFYSISSVKEIGIYPGEHENGSLILFDVFSGNEELVEVSLEDSNLILSMKPGATGETSIVVSAYDSSLGGPIRQFNLSVDSTSAPVIASQPLGRTVESGTSVTLAASPLASEEDLSFEWFKDGEAIADSNASSLDVSEGGSYTVAITNSVGSSTSNPALVNVVDSLGSLVNVSTRGYVGTGHQAMIAGVVVSGDSEKELLLRGVSEGLSSSGLDGLLDDSNVIVYDENGVVGSNDNWGDFVVEGGLQSVFTSVGATDFLTGSKDSALVSPVTNGARTLVLNGVDNAEGLALVEVYDADQSVDSRIVNLSTRAMVKEGSGVAIVGFVIGGDGPVNVLIRGGSDALKNVESLQDEPILENPNLAVVSGEEVIALNLDWDDSDSVQSMISIQNEVGATPFEIGSNDSLLFLTLEPGIYSAVLAGGEGLGLVEIFEVR